MDKLFIWILLAALISAIFHAKIRKRRSSKQRRPGACTVSTVRIRPNRQPAQKPAPAFDMAYEYDFASRQYYALADSLLRDAKRETDATKAHRLKCKAAEAILKADRHALKSQA